MTVHFEKETTMGVLLAPRGEFQSIKCNDLKKIDNNKMDENSIVTKDQKVTSSSKKQLKELCKFCEKSYRTIESKKGNVIHEPPFLTIEKPQRSIDVYGIIKG